MLFWFAGASIVIVWAVFRSPALDYRLVVLGSVLPVGEVVFGGPWILHTLVASAAVLVLLVLATQKSRLVRRRLIGLPIGLLMHLVLDGVWTRRDVFWWPFFGGGLGEGGLPELERPLAVIVVLDAIGLACLVWSWRRFGLDDAARRRTFLHTGHLDRSLVG
jgi:hypothetical protein